jgi:apolipoprotein N-acyltransferase
MKRNNPNPTGKKSVFFKIFLLIISSLLFWLSNPNILFEDGLYFIAWFNYLPVLFLIKYSKTSESLIFGALYGIISYALYGYWLQSFHPLGLIIVCIGYMIICSLFFLVLKWAASVSDKNSWLLQFFCICGYEYLKTLGYFGINYGVTAYTQWKFVYLIQICSIVGVFGLNLLVIFPSAFFFSLISKKCEKKRLLNSVDSARKSHISAYVKKEKALSIVSLKLTYACGLIWLILITASLVYGISVINKNEENKYVTVAAIQNNESPWKNGIEEYSKNVKNLIQLTEEAQSLSEVDFVVWPETAVAPSIIYNYDYGTDVRRFMLISQLLNFLDENNAVFVIGNSHEVELHGSEKVQYNSALVFESGKNVHPPEPDIYSKIKLVPFTESFPMKHIFPLLYIKLLNGNTHMWEKGDEYTVFEYRDLKFSTPICFEDTFSSICRKMVLNGSRCFFNLSNDSWSGSIPCQRQHLAMAVFRCVENRVPAVRSTASGVTCIINEKGIIEKQAPEFCQAFVIGRLPVRNESQLTPFTLAGDAAGIAAAGLSAFILIIQSIIVIIKKNKK